METPAIIYLMATGDGIDWCSESAPGEGMCPEDAVKYVRIDVVAGLSAQAHRLRVALDDEAADIRRTGDDVSDFAANVLAEKPINI